MLQFDVDGMTCGHCVQAVTRAVKAVDSAAEVNVDLAAKRVAVETRATADAVAQAITEAGYPVSARGVAAAPASRGGCGCGCG